jgi:hypothetical protein
MALGVAQNPPYIHMVFQDQSSCPHSNSKFRWPNTTAKIQSKAISLSAGAAKGSVGSTNTQKANNTPAFAAAYFPHFFIFV